MNRYLQWYSTRASMRKKLIISFMLLILVPTVLLGAYSYYVSKINMFRQTQLAMESNARSIAFGLESSIRREDDNIKYMSYDMTYRGILDDAGEVENLSSADPSLWYYANEDADVEEVSLVCERVDEPVGDLIRPVETVDERIWYDMAVADTGTQWHIDENYDVYVTRAVLDRETLSKRIGMLIFSVNRDSFFSLIDQSTYQNNGLFILDSDGEVIRSKPMSDMSLDARVLKDIRSGYVSTGYQNNGDYMLVATEPISNGWVVYYYVGHDVIGQITGKMLGSTILLVGATLLIAIFLIYFISGRLSERINRLQEMAESVKNGNYEIQYMEDETDEIGGVAKSLHEMAVQIQGLIMDTDARRIRDVGQSQTDLQYREWLFDFVVERNRDIAAIFTADDFSAQFVSANAAENLGLDQQDIIDDVRVVMDVFPGQRSFVNRDLIRRMGIGEVLERDEMEAVNPVTSEHRWYRGLITRTDYNNGRSYVLVLYDRTDELLKNHQLEETIEIARSANEAKTNFLANMSHDFRTPMNAITNFNLLIDKHADDAVRVREYSRKIDLSCRNLLMILNDVLDMSKIESGKTSLVSKEFSMNELIEEVNNVIGEEARGKGVNYRTKSPENGQEMFVGDPQRINEVLTNLLSNAVKYTPSGGEVCFTLDEASAENEGYWDIKFEVKDNGVGISEAFMSRLFEPFAREVKESTRGIQGTGLGMSITRNLVELMGGAISVESEDGKGSTFTVSLRLQGVKSTSVQKDAGEEEENTGEYLTGLRILAAEDNDLNADILSELFGMFDSTVERARDGEEVVEMFMAAKPGTYDMILMDIQMPGMNGYEAAEAIRALDRRDAHIIPIIAMTANAYADDVQRSYDAGMDAHVSKPVDLQVLARTIIRIRGSRKRV